MKQGLRRGCIFFVNTLHVGASFISLAPTFFKSHCSLILPLLLFKPQTLRGVKMGSKPGAVPHRPPEVRQATKRLRKSSKIRLPFAIRRTILWKGKRRTVCSLLFHVRDPDSDVPHLNYLANPSKDGDAKPEGSNAWSRFGTRYDSRLHAEGSFLLRSD